MLGLVGTVLACYSITPSSVSKSLLASFIIPNLSSALHLTRTSISKTFIKASKSKNKVLFT
jgi:hypothetical protein